MTMESTIWTNGPSVRSNSLKGGMCHTVYGISNKTEPYCAQVSQSVHIKRLKTSDLYAGIYGKQHQNLLIPKHCTSLYISNEYS